jgi:hypothetical protein
LAPKLSFKNVFLYVLEKSVFTGIETLIGFVADRTIVSIFHT